jgi:8-oxo-dGTP diphosphatase
MTTVAACVLERDGRILICQRRADQPHALKWEFPGGKLEEGESPEAALIRELREELGIEATPGPELMRYEFAYPGKQPILLVFLRAAAWRGEVVNRIFGAIAWARPDAMRNFDFLDGDARFLMGLSDLQGRTEHRAPDSKTS